MKLNYILLNFLLIWKHSLSNLPLIDSCLNLLWKAFARMVVEEFFTLYPIFFKYFFSCFSSNLEIFKPLNLRSLFFFKLCQIPIFIFASFSHGNFSPGSFFLLHEISEWPRKCFLLILYFLERYFEIFIILLIWYFEKLW